MKTTALLLTFVFAIVTVQPALADSAEEQVKELMDCYALGSDIITRAIDADSVGADLGNPVNLITSPIFAEGHGFYSRCATPEWEVTLQLDSDGKKLKPFELLEQLLGDSPVDPRMIPLQRVRLLAAAENGKEWLTPMEQIIRHLRELKARAKRCA